MDPPGGDDGNPVGTLPERFRSAAHRLKTATGRHEAVTEPLPERPMTLKMLPVRYQVKEDEDGRYLTCLEASNISVRIDRSLSVSASSARKYPKGTIFLDGAAKGEPFIDSSRGVYNFDHHEGCVRSFTLSTCEQAMIVIRKGLDLDGERWTVWANDPDLDTVLAIWLLLNHRRINENGSNVRKKIMPIVRLQGVIDAHGFELKELTAFPDNLRDAALTVINGLRSEELELKKENRWGDTDFLDFTLSSLGKLDELVYTAHDFEEGHAVEELAREGILPQKIAVACRSEAGIYEVEEQLRDLHGDRLGLIILEKEPGIYTLRQVDPFLPTDLEALYDRLNLLDSEAVGEARWGGSNEIGGSPRGSTTGLSLREIMFITRWVYQPPSGGRRLAALVAGVSVAAVAIAVSIFAGGVPSGDGFPPGLMVRGSLAGAAISAAVLAVFGLGLVYLGHSRQPGRYGLRRVRGFGSLAVLPVTAVLGLAGGAWIILPAFVQETGAFNYLVVLLIGVVGIETLLRGALHGHLLRFFPVMAASGRVFISVPNAVAAVVYSAAVTLCMLPPMWLSADIGGGWMGWAGAALIFGLVCGGVRERSRSLWAAVILHTASAIAAWFVLTRFF
jgi:membrane protease YdiL (CAAX protease family)